MKTKTDTGEKSSRGILSGGYAGIAQKAALLIWVVLIVIVVINRDRITADSIMSYTPESALLAALMMMGLFALKTLSIVFSSWVLYAVSGLLFDLPAAIAVSFAGALVMLLEGYALGHAGGQRLVESLSAKYPRFRDFTGLKDSRPFLFSLLLRMMKFVNYDIGSMYMGASGVPIVPYLGGSLVALLPEIVLFTVAGKGLSSLGAVPAAIAAAAYFLMTAGSTLMLRHMMKHQ